LVLWQLEESTGFALYTWMFWFIVPAGAIAAGVAGASGYLAGSWYFGHRPTRLLLLNILMVSVVTYLLIQYLAYSTLVVQGRRVADYLSFWQYLDIAIESTSMHLLRAPGAETGELGLLGYVPAALQVFGFALGGLVVYGHLSGLPYCDNCSRYLTKKCTAHRFTSDATGLETHLQRVGEQIGAALISDAIATHLAYGSQKYDSSAHLRTTVDVRRCKTCDSHWVKLTVSNKSGDDWKEIDEATVAGFTEQTVSV
jgi:hypothetical protein